MTRISRWLLVYLLLALAGNAAWSGGALSLPYTLPADGEVTLGVFHPAGKLLRWITRADFRYAGANRESWDGLDQWGQPLPAGTYAVKGIVHPPLTTEHTQTLGNPGTPPWPTADGTGDWLSDEATPQAAATDGKWVFLAAPGSEKGWAILAVDERGRRVWGVSAEFAPRCVSLAVSGEYLYALFSGPELTDASQRFTGGNNARERALLLCLDKHTGKLARFSKERPQCKIATWPYREAVVKLATLRTTHGFTPGVYGGQPRYACNDLGEATSALGIAVLDDRVYASFYYDNKVRIYDAATAAEIGEIPLTQPVGLHARQGILYAVSGTRVVRLDLARKRIVPIITAGLVAPHSLTTDAQGNLYVSDWGAAFQVKGYSPTGTFLRAIGKPGGRPWIGAWDPHGMLVPRGVAVTDDGKLWVAEDDNTPKRVSVWDSRTGAFLRDYLGPTAYGGGTIFAVDPADPSIVYHSGLRWKVDAVKKTSTPLATIFRAMDADALFMPNGHNGMPGGVRHFTRQGKQYMAFTGNHQVVVLMQRGDGYVPVAAAGGISRLVTDDGTAIQVWDSDLGTHLYRNYYPDFFRGHAGDNYSWTDVNADGRVQADEMRWVKTLSRGDVYVPGRQAEWMTYWGAGIAPDLSLFYTSFCRDMGTILRLDVQGWTPQGAPIYDIATATTLYTDLPGTAMACYVNAENKLFVTYRYEWRQTGQKNILECRERDGTLRWSVALPPEQPLAKDYHAENIIADFNIPGIGNVLGTWLWHGNYRPYLLTSDGLYLGSLLQDTKLGPQATWDESFKYYFQNPDGTPYIVNGANDALHLLAIRGLEHSTRFTTTLTLTPEDVRIAAAARALPAEKVMPKPVLTMRWADTPPTIDGALDDWAMRAGATLTADGGRSAQVALARDTDTLYLAYRVQDATPLLNLGEDWQKLFITGDCVDLMLATDSKADPHRRAPAAGDVRLLLSVFQQQPLAVLYRPVAPESKAPVQFMGTRIDEVRKITVARVAVQRTAGAYIIEAAVPLRELGLDPIATDTLRGDVGVIFSDETGHNRTLRLYYYNKQTTITADLTTEATLEPSAWGPLTLPLGRNLIKNGSFESPFTAKQEEGWHVGLEKQGMTAQLVTDSVRSGAQALLIAQTTPLVFPPEAYALPSFADFLNSANGGKGTGHLSMEQLVPVTGGKLYAFRMFYRTEDFQLEKQQPGGGRGYVALTPFIFWQIPGKPSGTVGVTTLRENFNDWQCVYNTQNGYFGVAKPYLAPDGATAALISFKCTNAAARLPKIWIDDVEFVEVNP